MSHAIGAKEYGQTASLNSMEVNDIPLGETTKTLDELLPELLVHIVNLLGIREMGRLSQTCSNLRSVCDDDSVWRRLAVRILPDSFTIIEAILPIKDQVRSAGKVPVRCTGYINHDRTAPQPNVVCGEVDLIGKKIIMTVEPRDRQEFLKTAVNLFLPNTYIAQFVGNLGYFYVAYKDETGKISGVVVPPCPLNDPKRVLFNSFKQKGYTAIHCNRCVGGA